MQDFLLEENFLIFFVYKNGLQIFAVLHFTHFFQCSEYTTMLTEICMSSPEIPVPLYESYLNTIEYILPTQWYRRLYVVSDIFFPII